jgi:hypothetical protein
MVQNAHKQLFSQIDTIYTTKCMVHDMQNDIHVEIIEMQIKEKII